MHKILYINSHIFFWSSKKCVYEDQNILLLIVSWTHFVVMNVFEKFKICILVDLPDCFKLLSYKKWFICLQKEGRTSVGMLTPVQSYSNGSLEWQKNAFKRLCTIVGKVCPSVLKFITYNRLLLMTSWIYFLMKQPQNHKSICTAFLKFKLGLYF